MTVRKSGSLRLTNVIDKGSWGYAGSNYFQYLEFDNFLQTTTKTNIVSFLKAEDDAELIKKLGVNMYSGTELSELVLVIEPATVFNNAKSSISNKGLHFGTYWEFQYWKNNYKSENEFGWVLKNVINNTMGLNLKTESTEINAQKTPEIWEFLDHFTSFKSKVTKETSLGVAIVTLKDVAPDVVNPKPITPIPNERKECQTSVTKGSCTSNYSIEEPTDKDCVVNNPKYKYETIGDCGIIYCSEEMSTKLNGFYDTFVPIIKSGSYFKMNSIQVDITKTCYLQKYSNNSCPNWQRNIEATSAGTIGLNLKADYVLIQDKNNSSFEVQCKNTSNGECTKAVAMQHIEYVLEPNTNRYISIKDMAGTATSTGDNIIDLGGEHLTTPIWLSTGKHNYTVDYSSSILLNSIKRLTNDTVELSNLTLKYSYDQLLTIGDLKYTCEYTTTNGDEICPPDECCEGNEIVPCPFSCVCDSITGCDEECNPNPVECDCEGECCDPECNVIDCGDPNIEPGGYPNLVYRPINLREPFPGQDGIGRDFGSNWHGNVYDTNGNTINKPNGTPYTKVEYYIDTNRGHSDYDVYHSKPLYIIKLDYDALSAIREYNELTKHNYNDFSLTCVNGQNCISNFLRGNLPNFNINLITSGECADSTTTNFSECTKRLGA